MSVEQPSLSAIYDGWHLYQEAPVQALKPLTVHQLNLRAAPHLRSSSEVAAHAIGAPARWFYCHGLRALELLATSGER